VVLRLSDAGILHRPNSSSASLASVGTTGAWTGRSGALKLANAASRIGGGSLALGAIAVRLWHFPASPTPKSDSWTIVSIHSEAWAARCAQELKSFYGRQLPRCGISTDTKVLFIAPSGWRMVGPSSVWGARIPPKGRKYERVTQPAGSSCGTGRHGRLLRVLLRTCG
jgi:hypothetical protein